MILKKQKLKGVYTIKFKPFNDKRGLLRRHFCKNELQNSKISFDIKQTNISQNTKKKTIRGFHFQIPPFSENKIISCIKGSIFNIVLDLRSKSKTFLQWESFHLNENNQLGLLVPQGCANAFMTLIDDTSIFYYHSEFFHSSHSKSIRYNDPFFKFKWPFEPEVISDKDLNIKDYDINNKYF